MSLKILLGSVGAGIVLVTGSYFIIAPRVSDVPSTPVEEEIVREYAGEEDDSGEVEIEDKDENESEDSDDSIGEADIPATPVTTTQTPVVPTPVPTPVPAPTPTPSGYTMADVAKHADATSCWSVIDGTVYDLTTFVSKHPGGKSRILGICGEDGTRSFENQHGNSSKVGAVLVKYRLGDLM